MKHQRLIAVPELYRKRATEARERWGDMVDRWLSWVGVGDPLADDMIGAFHRDDLLGGIERFSSAVSGTSLPVGTHAAPIENLFMSVENVPFWVDWAQMRRGSDFILHHLRVVLGINTGSTLPRLFASRWSDGYFHSGFSRLDPLNSLRMDNRFYLETVIPDGLRRHGDGFRLALRQRCLLAQARHQAEYDGQWNRSYFGKPFNMAMLSLQYLLSTFAFLKVLRSSGYGPSNAERDGIILINRYCFHLLGVPIELLPGTEEKGFELLELAEFMASRVDDQVRSTIHNILQAAGSMDSTQARETHKENLRSWYSLSRSMIGDSLADDLEYFSGPSAFSVGLIRIKSKIDQLKEFISPQGEEKTRLENFEKMLEASVSEENTFDFLLPRL